MAKKVYWIDWYTSGGVCYKSTTNCPYEYVKEARKLAKMLGETIKVEPM